MGDKPKTLGICAVCGEPIRLHSYKGWYHPDGKGKGGRNHSPTPTITPIIIDEASVRKKPKFKRTRTLSPMMIMPTEKAVKDFKKWFKENNPPTPKNDKNKSQQD